MSELVEQLLEMGFEEGRAKAAAKFSKTLDAAIEWLSANEGKSLDEVQEEMETKKEDEGAAGEEETKEAKSLLCQDCGKRMRNVAEAEWHASKSGHANFAESEEEKRPLTAEEKEEQSQRLLELIKEKKAAREKAEAAEALEKEKRRRVDGRSQAQMKQDLQDKAIREAAQERRRQKEEDKKAREKVLQQIAQDRRNREANNAAADSPSSQTPTAPDTTTTTTASTTPAPPKVDYDTARIQVRLLDGSALVHTFQATEQLAAVRLFAQLNRKDGSEEAFQLSTTFPRRLFTDEDMERTLKDLGLVPNAVVVATKATV